jgi:hypothetical protein
MLGGKQVQAFSGLISSARVRRSEVSYRQFFFNESGPARAYSVHYVYAPVEKIEIRFEERAINGLISDIVRTDCGRYRGYGSSRTPDERVMGMRVWESDDGITWAPVNLGQVGDTNLIFFENLPGDQSSVSHPQVIRLRDGRWRMYLWKHKDGHLRYIIAESEDGLKWRVTDIDKPALYHPHDGGLWKLAEGLAPEEMIELKLPPEEVMARKRLWTNDASNVIYNDQLDRFECYSVWLHPAIPDRRVDVDNAPGVHRLIQRRLSDDGINFGDPQLVLMPDERDPWDLQFYFLSPHWHEDFMIGCVGYYRVEDGQQTMDTDLCFSWDGAHWQRPVRGGWIPRSPEDSGEMDIKGIYVMAPWIDLGDRWLAVYSATPNPHNKGPFAWKPMGATFPKHRFVGVAAGRVPGGFMSEPFFPRTDEIKLDANIRGWLKAELCDGFGRKMPEFNLNDSIPITGDSEAHILKWKNASVADHLYECLRLRFEYQDGEIYNFEF